MNHRRQNGHRVGRRRECVEVEVHVLVQHLVLREEAGESFEFRCRGKFAVDEQIGGFDEGALLGKLGNVVTAVLEDPLFAIDEGDRAFAGTRVAVARIKRDTAGFVAQRGDVDADFAFRSNKRRQLERLAVYNHFHCSIHAGVVLAALVPLG